MVTRKELADLFSARPEIREMLDAIAAVPDDRKDEAIATALETLLKMKTDSVVS